METNAEPGKWQSLLRQILVTIGAAIAWIAIATAYLWGCGAWWWSPLGQAWVRILTIALFLSAAILIVIRMHGVRRWATLLGVWFVPFSWFWFAPPTNTANWQPASRVAPTISFDGDRFTVNQVRNFRWRSDHDFDERWETRTYDISKLRTLDLFLSYWGPSLICHTFVSFGFEDGRQLIVSVEVRRKIGQTYGTVSSCFREYELIYVFADELDVVYTRTNVSKENVRMVRIDAPIAGIRGLLIEYIQRANRMAAQPEWYNAITNSCGVNIVQNAWAEGSERSLSWRLLLNGEWPRYAYDAGRLGSGKPFEQIFQECIINPRAQAAGYSPDFSRAIRNGPIVTFRVPRSFDPTKVPEIPPPGIDRPVK